MGTVKNIRISVMMAVVMVAGFSPKTSAQFFSGGIVGGLSASQIDGDSFSGYNKVGIIGGAWVRRMFSYTVGGQIELRYIGTGSYQPNTPQDSRYYKAVLHNIDMPVLANYFYKEDVIFELGLTPSYLISSREEDANGTLPEEAPFFHKFNLSAMAGIGYTIWDVFTVNARFNYSVIPIRDHPSGQTYLLNQGQYSNYLTFTVYYEFKSGK